MKERIEELTLAHFKYFPEILGFKLKKILFFNLFAIN